MKKRRFTDTEIRRIRSYYERGRSCAQIARGFTSTKSNIAKIIRRDIYADVQ